MKLKQTCKVCETSFVAIKATQKFCSRKCFKRDYYLRIKRRQQEELANPVFPKKICTFCLNTTVLNFDPIKSPQLFNDFRCPNCNVSNRMVWANSDQLDSKQIISNLIQMNQSVEIRTQSEGTFHKISYVVIGSTRRLD